MNRNTLIILPKAELHRHLDGSVRFQTIVDLARHHHLDLGVSSVLELRRKTRITEPMQDLKEVLDSFWTTQKVLCSYEAIKRVSFENVEDAYRDGIRLIELRFAPVFIAEGKKIRNDEIIEGVLDGISEGMARYPIQVGLIGILPRTMDLDKNRQATEDLLLYKKGRHRNADRICGFDLADDEVETAAEQFTDLVDQAREGGLGITIHTGESSSADHVARSLTLYSPQRIGHGIKIEDNEALYRRVRDSNIMLELCPTSNWLTRSVPSLEEHPLPRFYHQGLPICINSDDPHLFHIDLIHEYLLCRDLYDLDLEDFRKINVATVKHSFLDEDIKAHVLRLFDEI